MERQRPGQVFILGQGLGVGRGCLRSPRGGHCGTKAQAQLSVGCGSEGRVSLLLAQVCTVPSAQRQRETQGRPGGRGPPGPKGLAASKGAAGGLAQPTAPSGVTSRTAAVLGSGLPGQPAYLPVAYSGPEQCVTG